MYILTREWRFREDVLYGLELNRTTEGKLYEEYKRDNIRSLVSNCRI